MSSRVIRILAVVFLIGCTPAGCEGTDPSGVDAGDAEVDGDVIELPDAGVDGDAEVDAGPNPNVYDLPPSGLVDIKGFTNAGSIITYAQNLGSSTYYEIFYFDVLTMVEHQVTNREGAQLAPYVFDNEIMYGDHQYVDISTDNHQAELYHFDIAGGVDTRLTNQVSLKIGPKFNRDFVLYLSNEGCATLNEYNLTLLNRATSEATVVSDCGLGPETYSISEHYAAWVARPAPGLAKDVYVHDLQAGVTFRIDSTEVGNQAFPHTDEDHVIWQDSRDGRNEIYMHTFSTGQEECLTPDVWGQARPHLRDGIVSWCDYRYSQQSGQYGLCDIYIYELATGVGRRVTSQSQTWNPRFVDAGWMLYGLRIVGPQYKLYAHDLVTDGILTSDGHVIP